MFEIMCPVCGDELCISTFVDYAIERCDCGAIIALHIHNDEVHRLKFANPEPKTDDVIEIIPISNGIVNM